MAYEKKRRMIQYLLKPQEQLKYFAFVFLAVSVSIGLVCLGLMMKLKSLAPLIDACGATSVVDEMRASILVYFAGGVLFFGLLYGALSIMFSHRVFGALFAMEKYAEAVLGGDHAARIAPRANSQAKHLMTLVAKLGHKIKESEKTHDELRN